MLQKRTGAHDGREAPLLFSLGSHSKQAGDERDLPGYVADRDANAAQNILKLARPGHGLQEPTYTDGCCVS